MKKVATISVLILLVAGVGVAQDMNAIQQLLDDQELTELAFSIQPDQEFSVYGVRDEFGRFRGFVTAAVDAVDSVIERVKEKLGNYASAETIYTGRRGQRPLITDLENIARAAKEYLCATDDQGSLSPYLPDRVGFTVGFSAGPTVLTSVEYDTDRLCSV